MQARYDNLLLEGVTFVSATVLIIRIVLGYQRMADRWVEAICMHGPVHTKDCFQCQSCMHLPKQEQVSQMQCACSAEVTLTLFLLLFTVCSCPCHTGSVLV